MRYWTLLLLFLISSPAALFAADDPARLLPVPSCGGWPVDGKASVYDKATLSDRIDGEAEIFFPYGFQYLAYGRYAREANAFDVDVYRMGSDLDAFGMYANYRPDGAEALQLGSEGAVTPAQLFFYQDRYFVRLQSTGAGDAGKEVLSACAKGVSALLPPAKGAPGELALVAISEVEKGSVRYSATSLLGYDFFPRGLMADAVIAGEPARLFVLIADSPAAAASALQSYRAYLQQGGKVKAVGGDGKTLTGTDPLYGKVVAGQSGRYVAGMVRVKDVTAASAVLEKLRLNLFSH